DPDQREAGFLRAVAVEVQRFIARELPQRGTAEHEDTKEDRERREGTPERTPSSSQQQSNCVGCWDWAIYPSRLVNCSSSLCVFTEQAASPPPPAAAPRHTSRGGLSCGGCR